MSETAVKIDAKLVKELREKSGAPMGDCLKALQEAKGDMEDAFVVLRKRGMAGPTEGPGVGGGDRRVHRPSGDLLMAQRVADAFGVSLSALDTRARPSKSRS